jgi:glutamate-1-semialdehyde 2,1-aminomutase
VACVLAEPAMTNIGIVMPKPGFLQALRSLTRAAGALLIIDETHTISVGPGGCTAEWQLEPDIFVLGKPIASGIPAAVWGFSERVASAFSAILVHDDSDTGGLGGTLAGNALSLAALRATLESVLTPAAYQHTIALCTRFTRGVQSVIDEFQLPWSITQLGARAEYWFQPRAPLNGGEAAASMDHELERYMHLAALNRRVLLTPFHNMALIAPQATEQDIDHHTRVFRESVVALLTPLATPSSKL